MFQCDDDLYSSFFFFFNDTATTEIYTLSLHDALPIYFSPADKEGSPPAVILNDVLARALFQRDNPIGRSVVAELRRSEEHTSELQSPCNLVCRLLLEKKKNDYISCTASLLRSSSISNH